MFSTRNIYLPTISLEDVQRRDHFSHVFLYPARPKGIIPTFFVTLIIRDAKHAYNIENPLTPQELIEYLFDSLTEVSKAKFLKGAEIENNPGDYRNIQDVLSAMQNAEHLRKIEVDDQCRLYGPLPYFKNLKELMAMLTILLMKIIHPDLGNNYGVGVIFLQICRKILCTGNHLYCISR